MVSNLISCPTCNGTGTFRSKLTSGVCPQCMGKGHLEREHRRVTVPDQLKDNRHIDPVALNYVHRDSSP